MARVVSHEIKYMCTEKVSNHMSLPLPPCSGGIPGVRHVMLLANTKLLSMCGR